MPNIKKIIVGVGNGVGKQVRPKLPIPDNGLLGWRPLQSDLLDASGNGKDGSWYSGTGSFGTVGGKTGARVTRNGSYFSTQYIITTLNYQQKPITMCGRICYNTIPNAGTWAGIMTSSNAYGVGYTMGTRPGDNFYPSATFGNTTLRIATSIPSANIWYFWGATFDGTTMKTYLNGNLVTTNTSAAMGTAGGVWKLGCAMVNQGYTLQSGTDGYVRHCAVYNRALSDAEFLEFYNQTS